ncbi:MAG: ATP-binding protein [Bacteroidota bacterium]
MARQLIFISSVQKELQAERFAVRDYIRNDSLLKKHFDVFLFEELPAADRKPDDVYLEFVERSHIYLGLFGNEYGVPNGNGLSPTEQEFQRATEKNKYRIILVKGSEDGARDPKMKDLLRKAQSGLIRRRFNDIPDLIAQLYSSLIEYMEQKGMITHEPFHSALHPSATLDDISPEKILWFLEKAREERKFSLSADSSSEKTLRHLNLMHKAQIRNSALLLFGKNPQQYFIQAEVKCLHFHGTTVQKPIPSYQIFKGTVFEQIDSAVDFVLSKLNRSVIPSNTSPSGSVEYEIPYLVIREAIVNAVAHRDYTSNAAVQVSVFADRVEVRNPGSLPNGFDVATLRIDHNSVPHNPLLADSLFLTRYVEKAGTGTLDMIALSTKAELPEPDFAVEGIDFVTAIWRDWLTDGVLSSLDINERQRKALTVLKVSKQISNTEYQKITNSIRKTAMRDLEDLVQKNIIVLKGERRGAHYVLATTSKRNGTFMGHMGHLKTKKTKRATKVPNGPLSVKPKSKGDIKGTKGTLKKNGTNIGQMRHSKSRKKK